MSFVAGRHSLSAVHELTRGCGLKLPIRSWGRWRMILSMPLSRLFEVCLSVPEYRKRAVQGWRWTCPAGSAPLKNSSPTNKRGTLLEEQHTQHHPTQSSAPYWYTLSTPSRWLESAERKCPPAIKLISVQPRNTCSTVAPKALPSITTKKGTCSPGSTLPVCAEAPLVARRWGERKRPCMFP